MGDKKYDIFKPWLTLDVWQNTFIDEEGNSFLLCGRQVGKSTAAAIKAVELARNKHKKGEDILIISFTEKQAQNLFNKAYNYAEARYSSKIARKKPRTPTKHVFYVNDVKIACYAAGLTGEGLRGGTWKKIIIDEPRKMSDEVFEAVYPMLSVIGGSMDLLGTPGGKQGFFYDCSMRSDFKQFYISAEDCPRHSQNFLKAQREYMSELVYSQEYLAMFLDDLKRLFSDEWIKKVCTEIRPNPYKSKFFLGSDIGGVGGDESSFEIFDGKDSDNIIQVENITTKGKPETEAYDKIIELNKLYNKLYGVGIDNRGIGSGVYQFLIREKEIKDIVQPLDNARKATNRDKTHFVRLLREEMYLDTLMMGEKNKLHLLKDINLVNSLRSIQKEVIKTTSGRREFKIWGDDSHIAEGIIRGIKLVLDKPLSLWVK